MERNPEQFVPEQFRNFESTLKYPHQEDEDIDMSESAVEAARTGVFLDDPHKLLEPTEMALQAFERFIQYDEYKHSPEGLRERLGKELKIFGCSEKEVSDIKLAIAKMDHGGETTAQGGDAAHQWSVEKTGDGSYRIQVKNIDVASSDGETTKVTPIPHTLDAANDQKNIVLHENNDQEMGILLEKDADLPLDMGDIAHFQQERRDITDEEDTARRTSHVRAQNQD